MKSDAEIRDDVIKELEWDPQIYRPQEIGVAVIDGAVTLTGHVSSYAQKLSAAKAAERVYGVKAIANQIEVRLTDTKRDDSDIARAIAHSLEWNTNVPPGRVKARVEGGWVTLEGTVEYSFQRHEVARMVRNVKGVVGVTNSIAVEPTVTAEDVEKRVEETLKRNAELDARSIQVSVSNHTAKLYGHVHSLHEEGAVRAAAAAAPGIARVESHLRITP
ncbi:MAG TPA: BON domain-containing protein [Candidatus Dormibacteraeota bacterium]|jgi:osmotically-inducible protein OsmY|nr:BON domain-containing protein [Candidatus Dormibacteraeota bacterium]